MAVHELKCVLDPFQAKWDGKKSWEFRKNDRDYKEGDLLLEKEYDIVNGVFTGRQILEEVIWILYGGEFGVPDDCAIMSTKEITKIRTSVKEPLQKND